ncbi:hypothetical protein CRUP_017251 [Coryphaenoides rupestris]|nr:hypothetical protein CRUP_017251 [Coryphaenoides rupestris]
MSQKHKVGVLLCRAGQSTEEEMYNNEEASAAFSSFLELLGEQVLLKGFDKYAAQLDTKSESPPRAPPPVATSVELLSQHSLE